MYIIQVYGEYERFQYGYVVLQELYNGLDSGGDDDEGSDEQYRHILHDRRYAWQNDLTWQYQRRGASVRIPEEVGRHPYDESYRQFGFHNYIRVLNTKVLDSVVVAVRLPSQEESGVL